MPSFRKILVACSTRGEESGQILVWCLDLGCEPTAALNSLEYMVNRIVKKTFRANSFSSVICGLLRIVLLGAIGANLSGCASIFYSKLPTGTFSGKLDVEWIAPNQFIYRPHRFDPLIYSTADGHKIQPRAMFTDGGSIPRLFWSVSGFGPWDFAPGYIIHDWLFEQHHCKESDWQSYDFPSSALILAEAIKTQMVKAGDRDSTIVWAVHEAVSSPIARRLWDSGECKKPPLDPVVGSQGPAPAPVPFSQPIKILTIDFK